MNEYIEKVRQFNNDQALCAYVVTFGCQQNEADSEKICGMAEAMGYTIADAPEKADLIVVNTCAIREHAEQKALSSIGQFKHLKEAKPALIIGVCGCMVAQEHRRNELRQSYPYVAFSFPPTELDRFPKILFEVLQTQKRIFTPESDFCPIEEGLPVRRSEKHKAWVSIMYGCNNFCSYCIVPYVRDRERSRDYPYILDEVADLVNSGVKDIMLLGQNVNSYRGGCTFAELIEKIGGIDGDFRLRFMTSHPKDVPDELIAAMAASDKVAKHFHLPMQSGSDRILKAMNRHYDKAHYLRIVEKLRAAMPGIAITTDIIVGFPGESDRDFEETLDVLRTVKFDMIYSFIYSPRKGTPAAEMEDQIPDEIKGARMRRLLELQDGISYAKNQAMLDSVCRVLVDGVSKSNGGVYAARTEGNKLVHFSADRDLTGAFVNLKITRAEPFNLHGEIVE
ncbi:MAG: tRNA (N6-isopentenyl adenosine(37)-C2)-methylthiotransferase MiaB [Clostridia bacterium]|nr:tRNA (N6-isopentenyl adenosine(37)-C2)-methylthiotransferase MiaB [Clostridia bacterium]